MKKLLVVISIIALGGVFLPGLVTLAQPLRTPHQNPAAAKESLDELTLMLYYTNVLGMAAAGQYEDARSLLDNLKLARIPGEMRFIIERYNAVSGQLFRQLDTGGASLDKALAMLSENRISEAEPGLEQADAAVREARSLLAELEAATDAIGEKLGVFAVPPANPLRQVYDRLKQGLEQPRHRLDELGRLRQFVDDRHEARSADLVPAELSLGITPTTAFVGDSVTARGWLGAGGKPLPERELSLVLNEQPLSITTGPDGSYVADLTLPYEYDPGLALYAEYVPAGADMNNYQAAKSPPVIIHTMFYPTRLEALAPAAVHPGLPVTISGRVSPGDGGVERTVSVRLDDTPLIEKEVRGDFSLELTLPAQTPPGDHTLTLLAAPRGRYAGAALGLPISASRLPVRASLPVPSIVLAPGTIRVNGQVHADGSPVKDARISLKLGNSSSVAKTSADGTFTASVSTPFDLSLTSTRGLVIAVEPAEAWYAPFEEARQIFAINMVNTGLLLAGLIWLGAVVYRRGRAAPARLRREAAAPPPPRPAPVFTGRKAGYKSDDTRGGILSAYLSGLAAIQGAAGIPMTPQTTLREFLDEATPRLPAVARPFALLTGMAETALYSARRPGETVAVSARRLADNIREELHGAP
ncbi:MAG: hypothetical protein HY668_00905 [Chloroflexi bacterium]|nr:hypothetical protein [Chloroflexota bacterium]